MNKLVLLGTNFYNIDLAITAKRLGYETHIFGVEFSDLTEHQKKVALSATKFCDYYHKISAFDIEKIIKICEEIKPSGILSVGMDTMTVPINKLSEALNLTCNGVNSALLTTNKHEMKKQFQKFGVPTSNFVFVDENYKDYSFKLPVMVKRVDSSGKFGITKVDDYSEINKAIKYGLKYSKQNKVLIEDFACGKEYSVECISWKGEHHVLAITEKFSEAPHFVEEMHLQPAIINQSTKNKIEKITKLTLDSVYIKYGASHTEIKIDKDDNINVIETAGRMGAESIWDLVNITTGVDFLKATIEVSVGKKPDLSNFTNKKNYCFTRYILDEEDHKLFNDLYENHYDKIVNTCHHIFPFDNRSIFCNANRYGYFVMKCSSREEAIKLAKPKSKC